MRSPCPGPLAFAETASYQGISRGAQNARREYGRMSMTEAYTRDFVGYGADPPDPKWPKGARIAVQFVVNYEEGGPGQGDRIRVRTHNNAPCSLSAPKGGEGDCV